MPDYRVLLARSAERDFRRLPSTVQQRLAVAIDNLTTNPRPAGVKKLRGKPNLWRIRVGDYRIIYRIEDAEQLLDIAHIRHRREAYA